MINAQNYFTNETVDLIKRLKETSYKHTFLSFLYNVMEKSKFDSKKGRYLLCTKPLCKLFSNNKTRNNTSM